MLKYNNDLKTLSIPTTIVKSDLSYASVNVKEYSCVSVGTVPNPHVSSATIPAPVTVNKTTTIIGVPVTTPLNTPVAKADMQTTTPVTPTIETSTTTTIKPSEQVTTEVPTELAEVLSRVSSEGMTNLAPMIPKLPAPSVAHSHSAYDVYETETRIWFTPDERLELRGTYAELVRLKADINSLVPKINRVVTFCIPDVPDIKNMVEIRFPWSGVLKELEFNYSRYDDFGYEFGPTVTKLNVQKGSALGSDWVDVLPEDVTLSEDVKRIVLSEDLTVHKDDTFRLRFSSISTYIKNIVVQLVIDT